MQQPWRVKEISYYSIRATAADNYGYPMVLKANGRVSANQSTAGLNFGATQLVQIEQQTGGEKEGGGA